MYPPGLKKNRSSPLTLYAKGRRSIQLSDYSSQPSFRHERQNAPLPYFCLIRRGVAFTIV